MEERFAPGSCADKILFQEWIRRGGDGASCEDGICTWVVARTCSRDRAHVYLKTCPPPRAELPAITEIEMLLS